VALIRIGLETREPMDIDPRAHAGAPVFAGALSIVVPVFNEQENIRPLVTEIRQAIAPRVQSFEIVYVDDASTDGTADELARMRREVPELRVVRHAQRSGQSTALQSGVLHASHEWIATLDGDGQNDPADIVRLIERLTATEDPPRMLVGWRTRRNDTWLRRLSSRIANGVRSRLLGDGTPDTGCGLKLFERSLFLRLPHFDHMHRFLPALAQRAGARVESVPVGHRPRSRGRSKYGLHDRLWVGIVDLFGVMWLMRRARLPGAREVGPE
jgi:dolichol-phosphate mannosyltransferase